MIFSVGDGWRKKKTEPPPQPSLMSFLLLLVAVLAGQIRPLSDKQMKDGLLHKKKYI